MQIPPVDDIEMLLTALEARRPMVAAHCRRVSGYAVQLAIQYGLPDDVIEAIHVGGLLHDLGKLMVPATILSKPGRLTRREWRTLQGHPEHGFEMAERLGFARAVTDIVLYHHERLDCSGYPDGLTGAAIPWTVRIISVMDAFDAITSPRAYRAALSVEAARAMLAREAAGRYCPWVVTGLMSMPRSVLAAVARGDLCGYRPDTCPGAAAVRSAVTAWRPTFREEPGYLTAW